MRYWLCLFAALALLCLPAGAVELPKELTDALPSQAERLLEGETIYRMASLTADLSTPSTDRFILPDGTVLLDT